MIELLNSAILGLSIILFLHSYKKELKIKKCIIFYIVYIVIRIILNKYIKYLVSTDIYLILKISLYYLILKLIFKKYINILDIFYIMYANLFIELSNKILKREIIANIIILVISFIFIINKEKVYKLSCKIINIWNENCEKSLTFRNIFLICFNISVFIICNLLLR